MSFVGLIQESQPSDNALFMSSSIHNNIIPSFPLTMLHGDKDRRGDNNTENSWMSC